MTEDVELATLLRSLAPQVLGVIARRHGEFDRCEDAVQEALLAAATAWPVDGRPNNPTGWLVTVASRRWTDRWRQDAARRRRERLAFNEPETPPTPQVDDSLAVLLMCCHPSLPPASQVALTLRAVGGLTTAEIARALLVPEATVGQRISRAKQRIRASGAAFGLPQPGELPGRIAAVLAVLYSIFTEGSTASSGPALHRPELSTEAIRLTRQLHRQRPDDGEVSGLLALMLLTDARRPARTGPDGALVSLAEQDRTRWDQATIREGTALVDRALRVATIGPYQLQAAIAAVHDEAGRPEDTDWVQILALYDLLEALAPGPMVTLNRIVALAMADGPDAGLRALAGIQDDPALADHHRTAAVHAHLLEQAGDRSGAQEHYLLAARRTLNLPERRYLESRAQRLEPEPGR